MPDWRNHKYSKIDLSAINNILFYPRSDPVSISDNQYIRRVMIPVGNGEVISSLWAEEKQTTGAILFFHGNGELASEYVDMAELFLQTGIDFICADYRGYGHSSGNPTVSFMIEDAHEIFKYVHDRIKEKNKPFIVMGRSLGCVPALEIAAVYGDVIDGLIIESGFAETLPLFRTLGADADYWKIREEDGFANIDKIKSIAKPLLIIHAEEDSLIPIDQAEKLFAAAISPEKKFLRIPHAGHNDIFFAGRKNYLMAVNELIKLAAREKSQIIIN